MNRIIMKKQGKTIRAPSIESTGSLDSKDSNHYDQLAGELLMNRYILLKFLSYGTFANVYLAYDITRDDFVVIKIQNTDSYNDALEEHEVMKILCKSGHPNIVQLLDTFSMDIESERHFCFVLELLGPDIYTVLNEIEMIKLSKTKEIIRQLLKAIEYVTKEGYIHTDLKPENIMITQRDKKIQNICDYFRKTFTPKSTILKLKTTFPEDFEKRSLNSQRKYRKTLKQRANKQFTESIRESLLDYIFSGDYDEELDYTLPEDVQIKLVDFGLCVKKDSNTEEVQTRNYRAPEVILLNPLNEKIDIWSVGCLVYDLLTGETMFEPEHTGEDFKSDREHLALMYSILGKMPLDLALDSELSDDFFDSRGRVKGHKKIDYKDLTKILGKKTELSEEECKSTAEFIKYCCAYYPKQRPNVSQLLEHSWFR